MAPKQQATLSEVPDWVSTSLSRLQYLALDRTWLEYFCRIGVSFGAGADITSFAEKLAS